MKRETDPAGSAASSELRGLFDRALELVGDRRQAYLHACQDSHPVLAHELARLLEQHETLGGFLAEPVHEVDVALDRLEVERLVEGEILGDYRIGSFLGRGGSGSVHRAHQRSLGRDVALKVAWIADLSTGERERFLRGARMAAATHHPHLAQVFDYGEDAARGLLYYSMRLVEGRTLQAVLEGFVRDGAPDSVALRRLVERVHEIAEALGVLHSKEIIHQDVKPANILIEGESGAPCAGEAVLVDFGLLKDIGTSQALSTVWATLPYAAPEVLLRRKVDARADVYALGMCLYDLCAGATPAQRQGGDADLARLSVVAPRVDLDLEAIVHRAVEAHPGRRYKDGADFAHDLGAWLAAKPVRARRLTRLELARRWLRAHPEPTLRWGLRCAGLFALLGGAAFGSVRIWDMNERAGEAEKLRRSGDIVSLSASVAAIPSPFRALLLSGETVRLTQELAQDAATARVIAAHAEQGMDGALLMAGAFLERDGLALHPELANFLLARVGTRQGAAIRLAARLLLERPVEAASDLERARPLRDRFEALLDDPSFTSEDAHHALTALGSCGDLDSIATLLRRIEQSPAGESESVRLGIRALEMLGRRSLACGFRSAWLNLEWDSILAGICPSLERQASSRGPDYGLVSAFEGLCFNVAVSRRNVGLSPLDSPCNGHFFNAVAFLAANGERRFLPMMVSESYLLQGDVPVSRRWGHFNAMGRLLGLFGDPSALEEVRRAILDLPALRDENLELRLRALDEGYAFGTEEWKGLPQDWRPDAETHLRRLLDEDALAWREFRPAPLELDPLSRPRTLALWTFDGCDVQLHGSASGLDARQAYLKPDDVGAFACLGIPGVSELRFRFRFSQRGERRILFRVRQQKGARAWLPYAGEASAILLFDGKEHELQPADSDEYDMEVPLLRRQGDPSGESEIVLRLDGSATTTFRVYQAEILLPEK